MDTYIMNFDFELVLVIVVVLFAIVTLVDVLWWKKARLAKLNSQAIKEIGSMATDEMLANAKMPVLVEYSRSFLPVLAIVLLLRSFAYEPYQIPSGSMLPGLQIGDFIVVNKHTYGIRLPVTGTKIIANNDPQRGDVMVFKYPEEPSLKYIKRIIGLPGDMISYRNKQLFINNKPVPQEYVEADISGNLAFQEILGEAPHMTWQMPNQGRANWHLAQAIPEGHYFVMGDNRDASSDSRVWGFVPDELVVGQAVAVWMQWKKFFSLPNFSTVGVIK